MNYIPVQVGSNVSPEYLKIVRFCAEHIEMFEQSYLRFQAKDSHMLFTGSCAADELLTYTGWTTDELIKFSRWDGKEGLSLYPNSVQERVTLVYFYIGKKGDFRSKIFENYWFHQVLPQLEENEVVFMINGAMGNLLKDHSYLLDHVKSNIDNLPTVFPQWTGDFCKTYEKIGDYIFVKYYESLDSMYILDTIDRHKYLVPRYAYEAVAEELRELYG